MAEARASLPRMLVAVIQAREAEAARVSRVLHDDVGQVLSAVGLQLMVLRMDLQDRVTEIGPRTMEIQELLERAVTRVRELSYELHSSVVERAGLQFALDRMVGQFREGLDAKLRFQFDSGLYLPLDVANSLYRIAERALDNAVRHAAATQISLAVRGGARGITLEVRDNGRGGAPEPGGVAADGEPPRGLGLLLMQSDAERAGLEFTVRSPPGQGTTVRAVHRPPELDPAGNAVPLAERGDGDTDAN